MTVEWSSDWRGLELSTRVQRATGRALIGIGEHVVVEAKRNADVISGTMRRSIHTAEIDYDGFGDESAAKSRDLGDPFTGQNLREADRDEGNAVLEVGSWVPYACVEEVGRGHRFVQPAIETTRGFVSDEIVIQAFAEEGLISL